MSYTKEDVRSITLSMFTARQHLWKAKEQLTELGLHSIAAEVEKAFDVTVSADKWLNNEIAVPTE